MDDLLELERRGWDALCDGSGAAFYGDLMTDDGTMVLAGGTVMSKEQVIDSLHGAASWESYDIDEPRTVEVCEESRALVYTGTGYRDGRKAFTGVMTSVYVREDGRWRLALYQQTPVG